MSTSNRHEPPCQLNPSCRLYLFSLVCIPTRIAIAVLTSVFQLSGVLWCLPFWAVGFGFVYKACENPDYGFFGGYCWWEDLRWFHAGMWGLAGMCVAADLAIVSTVLLGVDVAGGAVYRCMLTDTEDTEPPTNETLQT